ncbi:MAG: tRNA epoxyqueuosine(34) reductase QueG [Rhodospirillales bacterium]|nr:tRNA epoxyqueuosine(34) reductase QueG [Rhodospirillales bacterium]
MPPDARPLDRPPKEALRAHALALGFDAVGFAPAAASEAAKAGLAAFLAAGMQGDMGWMATHADRRADPRTLWPEARSVIVLAANYGPDHDPREALGRPAAGNISVYARNRDYHDTIKKRLKALGRWMCATFGGDCKVFVDTAPVMEKPLAQAAGLGWQGKHTNLVSRDFGSWLFLGAVFTTLDLSPDAAGEDHCGACRACLDACPTAAFPAPYRLDARRCISYLTIEHKGHIGREFRAAMGNRIYGCDDCLAACPWNKFASATREADFAPRADLTAPALAELAGLDDAAFRVRFAGSPVKRIGRDRFVRNVLVAVGNSGSAELAGVARGLAGDASPLVRAMAAWALSRLLPADEFAALARERATCETDAAVAAEWSPPT